MTHTQWLFFISHGCHLRIASFSFVTAYTHALVLFHWSWFPRTHCLLLFVTDYTWEMLVFFIGNNLHRRNDFFSSIHFMDFIYGWMYLSTTSAGFIRGQGDILHYSTLFILQRTVKWFQVLLCITKSSFRQRPYIYTHLNDQTVLCLIIQFSIRHLLAHSLNKCQTVLFDS